MPYSLRRKRLETLLKRTSAGSLRGKGDLRPANFSKTAVITENILVAAKDGAHDERIISVADLRNRIWDDVCFLGHVTANAVSFRDASDPAGKTPAAVSS